MRTNLRPGSFGRNVLTMAGGAAAGQLILLAVTPLLTRLFTAADFGNLAVYMSVLSLFGVIACWRYELALPLAEDAEAAANVLALTMVATCSTAVIAGMFLWLGGGALTQMLGTDGKARYWLALPAGIVAFGVYQGLSFFCVRDKAFGTLARTKIAQSLGQSSFQLVGGVAGVGPLGLVLGHLFGQLVGSGALLRKVFAEHRNAISAVGVRGILAVARRFRRFPLMSGPSGFLNAAGLQAPVLLFAAIHGVDVAGWFVLAQRVVAAPLGLIGTPVSQVYLSEAPRLSHEDPRALRRLFMGTAFRLALMGVAVAVILLVAGPRLFAIVFGESWGISGEYARLLAPMFFVQIAIVPLSQTLNVLERQDYQLVWDGARLGLVVATLLFSDALGVSASVSVALYGAAMFLAYLGLAVISERAIVARYPDA